MGYIRGLWQLHMWRISWHPWAPWDRCQDISLMGSRLHQVGWVLRWSQWHGTRCAKTSLKWSNELINYFTFSGYPDFGKYLNETGRPIVYSCSWPAYWGDKIPNYPAIAKSCNLWRNYGDIQDSYDDVLDIVDHYGDHQNEFAQFAGPGQWNDPDMVWNCDLGAVCLKPE